MARKLTELILLCRIPIARSCEHVNEPSNFFIGGDFFTIWATVSFSRSTLLNLSGFSRCWYF